MRLSRTSYEGAFQPGATGIVHLGIGAFARAHQAVFTEEAMAATGDDRWGICGATMRGPGVAERLGPQDGLYSVRAGGDLRVVGAVTEVLRPGDDLLTDRLAAPGTQVVTVTITEKGYRAGPAVDRLVRGLRARAAADAGPITVLSCDNLPSNGVRLATLVRAAAEPWLLGWLEEQVRFPCTMVDRIVPASTPADLAEAAARLGLEDRGAVVAEPFRQWVIEDDFAAGRPAWEKAGALLVARAGPYEVMKLRLLNGSHSALAYLSAREHVAEALGELREVLVRLMDEVTPTLGELDGVDLGAYKASLLERFANPELRHRIAQIAADGSQKLPQRLLDPARELLAAGREPRWIALVVAGWMAHVSTAAAVDDPLAGRLRVTGDADRVAGRLLAVREVFGEDLPEHAGFRELVTEALERLMAEGAAATVRAYLAAP
ncbi:mannitol dehydrogenase family protein [Nonomuraea endophytica]|uniref:mannitol dehydrogenase family protein n=1 Tax=Nonomuraea endophytica TaxID=714136 RepID=UPI0037CA9D54